MSWNFLGLWFSMALLSTMEHGGSRRHQHTFQVQIQCSRLGCGAGTVEMWVAGWALFHRLMGEGRPLPRTTALMASTALTSTLLRDVPDFKCCEISPSSEDTSVRICLRSRWEAMFHAIKNSSGMRRENCWHVHEGVSLNYLYLCVFWKKIPQ